jgi:plasmid stabilization system protein ParE
MGETHKVIFAPRSADDLATIVKYIAKNSSSTVAERFGMQLVNKALSLASMPHRGRVVPEVGLPTGRSFFVAIELFIECGRRSLRLFASGTRREAFLKLIPMNFGQAEMGS